MQTGIGSILCKFWFLIFSYCSLWGEFGLPIASSSSEYLNPNWPSSVLPSSQRPSVGGASIISFKIPNSFQASDEISHYAEYDYIIINENFDESLKRINSILIAEGLKRTRQNKIQDMIKSLRDDLLW